jgi:MFS transporter, SHS family, sialic acid transporter
MEPASGGAPAPAEPSRRRLTLSAAVLGWLFDGLEMGLFPVIARPALQELLGMNGDQLVGIWMGRITAVFLFGAAAGGIVFGWLGDRIGRVRSMALSILAYSIFTGLCYFAGTPWHLALFRFLAALGMGGEWSLGVALVMETWPSKSRPWLAGVIGASANVGFLLIAVISLLLPPGPHSWRWIMLIGALPALLTFLIRMFVPESERWKSAVRENSAHPIHELVKRPYAGRVAIGIILTSVILMGTWASVQWIPLWVGRITHGTHPHAMGLVQALGAVGAITGCVCGPLLAHAWGRRRSYFVLCAFSLLSCEVLFVGVHAYGPVLLVLAVVVGFFTATFYGWLALYLPELFPTRVRATAQGLSYNFGRIFAGAGALTAGRLTSHYDGDYARMAARITLVYAVGMIAILFAPETKGRLFPE